MNEEKKEKLFKDKGIVYIPQYKKIWYSITKFEKYPEMATEGVGRAFLYLLFLVLMFSIVFTAGLLIKFNIIAKDGVSFIDSNFFQINYENGELSLEAKNDNITTDFGNFVINTKSLTDEQIKEYENRTSLAKTEIILLKDKAIIKFEDGMTNLNYKEMLDNFAIKQFNKSQVMTQLNNLLSSPRIYIIYGILMLISLNIAYFITTLFDVLILSLFGFITTFFAKIQIRYRAIFNMSVYAITLSVVLKLIYYLIRLFTNFEIKYFDLMYTAISFICLVAAIFMIKSDVIKQQIELMRIIEKNKQMEEEPKEEKEEKENKEEEKPEKKKKEEKKDDDGLAPNAEGQTN